MCGTAETGNRQSGVAVKDTSIGQVRNLRFDGSGAKGWSRLLVYLDIDESGLTTRQS